MRPFPRGGRSVALLAPLAVALVIACDATGPGDAPASLEIGASRYLIGLVGDTVAVSATVRNADGDVLPDAAVSWTSRDEGVVDVNAAGLLTALGNGTTWVVARSGGATDSARFTVDSPVGCAPVADLILPDTAREALAGGDCTLGPRFVDVWILDVATPLDVSVEMKSEQLDAFLFIVDGNGETVDGDDNGGEGTDARVYGVLDAGRYFIFATTATPGATGSYDLSAYAGPPPSPCPARAAVTFPDTVAGSVGPGSCDYAGFYLDAWRLELADSATVTLRVDTEDFDPAIALTDTTGAFLDFSGRGPGTAAWLEARLGPGSYDLWVGDEFATGVSGAYTLAVRRGPSTVECPARGGVSPGDRVTGYLDAADCFVAGGVAEGWDLTLANAADLAVALTTDSVAPIVAFTDAAGAIVDGLLTDAFSATGQVSLPPGSYRLWVLGHPARESGYDLTVVDAALVSACAPTDSLGPGDSATGALAATDCALPDGRHFDLWSMRVDSALSATIALAGDTLDPFLMIADSAGRWIAANDDAAGQAGASVTRDFAPGRYSVWATSSASGSVGGYTLSTTVVAPLSTAAPLSPAAPVGPAGPARTLPAGSAAPGRWGDGPPVGDRSPWEDAARAARGAREIRPFPL